MIFTKWTVRSYSFLTRTVQWLPSSLRVIASVCVCKLLFPLFNLSTSSPIDSPTLLILLQPHLMQFWHNAKYTPASEAFSHSFFYLECCTLDHLMTVFPAFSVPQMHIVSTRKVSLTPPLGTVPSIPTLSCHYFSFFNIHLLLLALWRYGASLLFAMFLMPRIVSISVNWNKYYWTNILTS
jgi:hypothetical protein